MALASREDLPHILDANNQAPAKADHSPHPLLQDLLATEEQNFMTVVISWDLRFCPVVDPRTDMTTRFAAIVVCN